LPDFLATLCCSASILVSKRLRYSHFEFPTGSTCGVVSAVFSMSADAFVAGATPEADLASDELEKATQLSH
jgi:hypothetical protein